MIRSFLTVSTGTLFLAAIGIRARRRHRGAARHGPGRGCFPGGVSTGQCREKVVVGGRVERSLQVPAWLRVRETEGAVAAAAFAGRVLGTVSAALIAAAALIGLLMPVVVTALAPGFAGQPTLRLAVDDARLMLPYLAFAGPVTVMMALLNAQARFALTAFSPLLFNIALIGVMAALLGWRQDAHDAALMRIAATVGIAGLLQLLILGWRRGGGTATPLRIAFDARMRGFLGKAIPGMIAQLRAATACRRRGDHCVGIAIGGVVAVFRQPPDRVAARHCRRRHGRRAGARTDARAAQ